MKFSRAGLAAAALTFILSLLLVDAVYGLGPSIFDGAFPIFGEEEQYQHCSH